jgi:hypothetical protein
MIRADGLEIKLEANILKLLDIKLSHPKFH